MPSNVRKTQSSPIRAITESRNHMQAPEMKENSNSNNYTFLKKLKNYVN